MNNAAKLIRSRKSVFPENFIQKEISKDKILSVLENASFAPTHRITEPWKFVVFHSQEAKEMLAGFFQSDYKASTSPDNFNQHKYLKKREKVMQSGAVIAIVMEESGLVPEWEEIAATAMAVQNVWLSLEEEGLGGYWSSPASALENASKILPLAKNEFCLGFFYLGYFTENKRERKRTPMSQKVSWK